MLESVPGLAERMAALMSVEVDTNGGEEEEVEEGHGSAAKKLDVWEILKEMEKVRERGSDVPVWLELEELGIDDDMLCSMDLSSKFPNLVALNVWGNKLQNAESIVQELTKCRNLKSIRLNENPVLKRCGYNIVDVVAKELPMLEIFNSCFTSNYSKWVLRFCGGIYAIDNPDNLSGTTRSLKNISSLDLSDRRIHKLLSELFCPSLLPSFLSESSEEFIGAKLC